MLYAATSLAFIGGSLIHHGGQNPIEAVRHGAVVLTGPSRANFEDTYSALLAYGGAEEVRDAGALTTTVAALMEDRSRVAAMQRNAERALGELSGALERTIDVLLGIMPEPPIGPIERPHGAAAGAL